MSSNLVLPTDPVELQALLTSLRGMAATVQTDDDMRAVTSRIAALTRAFRVSSGLGIPTHPAEQASEVDATYTLRPHVSYLSDRIASAVRDVERGRNRHLAVSMPPRAGKSTLLSLYSPLWMLRRHPEWKIVLTSYDGGITTGWARTLRHLIEDKPDLGIALARDGGAGSHWSTLEGGGMYSTSVRGGLTGRGARVLIIDDPVKDFVEAHSLPSRQTLWDWWLAVAQTRLEPPYLVLVVMTRWHEDDFVGRLFSDDFEGDPKDWEKISLPAIADSDADVLGRSAGEPLYSPLMVETRTEALDRWNDVRRSVGTYTFSAMYQQRPAPARGAIFDAGWWRFWTMNADRVTEDGRVVYLDPSSLTGGRWLDSWDAAFKSAQQDTSGWVVGQRWVRQGGNRYLVAQQRGRWSFTQTLKAMERWSETHDPFVSPCGNLVHERLVEEKANGAAIIDVLKEQVAGIKPINPSTSKESRARAVTPEIESGNVYLPHPADPGKEWVTDFLSEVRNFPHDVADDQVDAMTQALATLRDPGRGRISVPGRIASGRQGWQQPRDVARAALTDLNRRRASG